MKRMVRNFLVGALWLLSAVATAGQAPSPEQLELFRNLTPEQQQAVMEEFSSSEDGAPASDIRDERRATSDPGVARDRTEERPAAPPAIPVMDARDTVLIEAAVKATESEQVDPAARERLERLAELIHSRNPYQLDREAQLNLPGFAPIQLRGLTEQQATQRLSLEPSLLQLKVRVTRLPLAKTGIEGLKRYGYDLFDNAPSTFAPVTDVPVPADYVVGPGDELRIQLYGSQNRTQTLTVTREGLINFPELGPIRVGGLTFSAAARTIESRVAQQMIGVQVSVSVGDTRAIRVLVSGMAKRPGSYSVDGLATMITALYASGGVDEIGSLRDIQLIRQGQVVRRFDLYDLLIHGDTSDDAKLLPGDVIFIPPVGPTVSVDGEVKRPAIYELRGEATVTQLVSIAGGLTPEADRTRVSLTTIAAGGRTVVDVDLAQPNAGGRAIANGDVLRVARLRPQIDSGVEVEGFVYRPGPVSWREGLRLSQVITSIDELMPSADQHYILIRREIGPDRRVSSISADLVAALDAPGSAADVLLERRDRITVFELAPGRERIIQPLLEELALQSDPTRPTDVVEVGGNVKVPGKYPREPDMRVSDLLRAGGGLAASAFGGTAELTRQTINSSGERRTELINIDLAAILRGDPGADVPVQPFDYLMVKETPDWREQQSVTLRGEVRFPGTYSIRHGETLWQVLERAGGLTPQAFPDGNVFTRRDLRELEQKQLDRLAESTRSSLAAMSLQAANAGRAGTTETLQSLQLIQENLLSARATGRFVIDLPGLLAEGGGGPKDVLLRDGDELLVLKQRQEVSVIGEVQNATSHLFQPGLKRDDYIAKSGGRTKRADGKLIYVVRADGSVATKGRSLLSRNYDVAIKPGDTIVVPLDTERMPRLPFWQAVTQILYNVAVSVAAVNSF
ncbi:MAG: SLBB domain-containing protein [Pseudomonadota bacterium]|nr:SLBB domain-containing protein [Pseudomonadota bacterium]